MEVAWNQVKVRAFVLALHGPVRGVRGMLMHIHLRLARADSPSCFALQVNDLVQSPAERERLFAEIKVGAACPMPMLMSMQKLAPPPFCALLRAPLTCARPAAATSLCPV